MRTKKEPHSQVAAWKQGGRKTSRTSFSFKNILPQHRRLFKRGGQR